jgi:hypothetical protein
MIQRASSKLCLPSRRLLLPPRNQRGMISIWSAPAPAAGPTSCKITYQAVGKATLVASAGSAVLQSGWAANDITLCVVNANYSISSISNGWTQIGNLTAGNSTAGYNGVWYRRMVLGDSAPAITLSNSGGVFDAICAGFRNCIVSGSPIDANSTDWTIGSSGSSKVLAVHGISSVTNYDLIVILMAAFSYHSGDSMTYSNSFSGILSWLDNNNSNEFFAGSKTLATAGATGSTNLTSGNLYTKYFSGFTLALKTS